MNNSPFKELFGESCNSHVIESTCINKLNEEKKDQGTKVTKARIYESRNFKTLLTFYLSVIVVCLTFLISVWYFSLPSNYNYPVSEVKSVTDFNSSALSSHETKETLLETFISDFTAKNYKVKTLGSFAYLYQNSDGDYENGLISMGDNFVYFQNGEITYFDTEENHTVLWDENQRKYVSLKKEKQYFEVTNDSEYYYKYYLGQHILQDFVNDYLKNKAFIYQLDENLWSWDWSFYTPVESVKRNTIKTEILIDSANGYISEIEIFDSNAQVTTFEFEFELIDKKVDILEKLQDYQFIY